MKRPLHTTAMLLALLPLAQACVPLVVGAGVGAGVMVAEDRRTSGTILEDQTIEIKAGKRISEKYGDKVNVSVTSFNRFVLLTGQAPTDEIKKDISVLVLEVEAVRNVQNELAVGNPASHPTDAYLTSKVKGRLAQNNDVSTNNVKVISEDGTVYLMGLVTRKEADAAAQTAATTSGAKRVVKLFEYLD